MQRIALRPDAKESTYRDKLIVHVHNHIYDISVMQALTYKLWLCNNYPVIYFQPRSLGVKRGAGVV